MGDAMRGRGRSTEIIMKFPQTGTYNFIVLNRGMVTYMSDLIERVRGYRVMSRCRFISFAGEDTFQRLRGCEIPTFVDHSVIEQSDFGMRALIDHEVARINDRAQRFASAP